MSRILLDTSGYSAFLRGHPGVKEEMRTAEEVLLSAVTIGELHAGFLHGKRVKKNQKELQELLASSRVSIAKVDADTAERYGVIQNTLWERGAPIPTNDIWIAAHAMQLAARLVTTAEHFRRIPQVLVRYYKP